MVTSGDKPFSPLLERYSTVRAVGPGLNVAGITALIQLTTFIAQNIIIVFTLRTITYTGEYK